MKNIYKLFLLSILMVTSVSVFAQIQFTMINHQTQTFSLTNFGSELDISDYRLCSEFFYAALSDAEVIITEGDLTLSTGESVTAIWETNGFTNTASDMGLYLPVGSFTNPAIMVCFVQYGAGDQGREDVAVNAGIWVEDTFVTGDGPYIYIGDGTQSGVEYWINFVEPVFPYVVINEVDSDTPSTDMLEFIELYGEPNASLDGLVLVFLNGLNNQSYLAFDLDGMTLNGDGFFLLGNAGVANAGIIIPDNTLQNGPDAVAIYQGSFADWPNGSPVITEGLVDVLVYDTDDADDTELLVLLLNGGQINEGQGGNTTELSCSRVPDGGEERNTVTYMAQGPTPGYSNVLPCAAGAITFADGGESYTLCTDDQSVGIEVISNTSSNDDEYIFIIATTSNTYISQQMSPLDMSLFAIGTYRVYGFSYTGTLGAEWIVGTSLDQLTSSECFEISSNFVTLSIEECIFTCESGTLSLGEGVVGITVCKDGEADVVTLEPLNNDLNTDLNFVLTDISNSILSLPNATFDLNELDFGSYRIWSFGTLGIIDVSTIEPGDNVTQVAADCFDLSSNFITVTVIDCTSPGCDELFFSEYIEGLASNKVLEIYNPLPFAVDLSQYMVLLFFNGNESADDTFVPTGIIEPGDVYVIVGPASSAELLAMADMVDNIASFNGDDAIELRHNSVLIDQIGIVGVDPGSEWEVGTGATRDQVLVRKAEVNNGETDWANGQNEWDVFEPVDFSHLGGHDIIPCGGVSLPYVFFDAEFTSITEEDGEITIAISVLNPVSEAVVQVSIFGGDATAGDDYTSSLPTTLVFPTGTTETQFVTITMIDDVLEEGIENIILNLSGDDSQVNFLLATHNVIIDNSDTYYAPYDIIQVTGTNTQGVADSVGIYCELSGIVHGPNFNNAGVQFTLIDETDGIGVFASLENFGYTVAEGDEVLVGGFILQFMGLTQIMPDYISVVSSGNSLEVPVLVTELVEENESHMARINCVSLVNPIFWTNQGGGFTVQVTDGLEFFDLRIDSDCDLFGTNPPEGTFNVVGIGSQFDTDVPYDSGYQLFPRYIEDVQDEVLADFDLNPDDFILYGDEGGDVNFTFTGFGAEAWAWDFGDGQTSDEENPIHTYSFDFLDSVSEVTVTLTCTGSTGCGHSYSFTIDAVYLGVSENELTTLSVFPNPSSNDITLISESEIVSVKILDLNGRSVWTAARINRNQMEIDLSFLEAGVYILNAETAKGPRQIRLVKTNG